MFNSEPFRQTPAGPAHAYETFQIATPRGPEYQRAATCEEVQCEHWLNGWVTRVPADSDLEYLIRKERSRRPWTLEQRDESTVSFTYGAGTPCFRASTHRVNVRPDLPQLFVVRGGDWRGNPTGARRVHQRPDDWVENLQESTESLRETIERG